MSTSFPFNNMRLRFAGETDIGKTHSHNEDNLYLPENIPLGIVADGMGGAAAGEVASKIAVEAISSYFQDTRDWRDSVWPVQSDPLQANLLRMKTAITYANISIYDKGQKDSSLKNMGTTVVAIYFEDNYAVIAHVGDSRIYRVRPEGIELLMEDHSFVNDMARMKHISPEEAAASGTKTNVVSRVLGPNKQVMPDVSLVYPKIGDIFIMCSDGLNDMISDDLIYNIAVETENLDEMCEKLVEAANDAGGEDNITALAIRIEPET